VKLSGIPEDADVALLEEEIEARVKMFDTLVGQLYRGIVADEIGALRARLRDLRSTLNTTPRDDLWYAIYAAEFVRGVDAQKSHRLDRTSNEDVRHAAMLARELADLHHASVPKEKR
jgi:hypothetical protein